MVPGSGYQPVQQYRLELKLKGSRIVLKRILSVCLAAVILTLSIGAAADKAGMYDEKTAYILNPPTLPEEPETKNEFINLLMVGVDYGIHTSGKGKKNIKNCHTDSVKMIAIDLTDRKISVISIPRDTLTYVPGTYGIYKLNAAINCAATFDEGIESVQNTVSWLLGGIRPDHYLVITPHLVEQIGDRIGGLDIDVEMNYKGHSGTSYKKGPQHLDGVGIMDYSRARRNASKNNNDIGRISRQRAVLTALYQKIQEDTDIVFDILDVLVENYDQYFFSDLSEADIRELLPLTEQVVSGKMKDYVLSGDLTMAMKYFTGNFFDQQERVDTLREVYGIKVSKQRLNTRGYLNYLFKYGFAAVKTVRVSTRVIDWASQEGYTGDELDKAIDARKKLIDKFSEVDDKLDKAATLRVDKLVNALKQAVVKLKKASGYPEKLDWSITQKDKWYLDPDINQYNDIDWN